jgi:hypothetical protein
MWFKEKLVQIPKKSFSPNYFIFRNVEILRRKKIQQPKFLKEIREYFDISWEYFIFNMEFLKMKSFFLTLKC